MLQVETQTLWLFCRPGFEADAGQELVARAAELGVFGYFVPGQVPGWVSFQAPGHGLGAELLPRLHLSELVFVRDWVMELARLELPGGDRVGSVLEALREEVDVFPFERLEVHVPAEGAPDDLARFARKWTSPLARALRDTGWLVPREESPVNLPRLDILLPSFEQALLCASPQGNRSPFVGGVPRLRFPPSAPSRSTLKLEEAWKLFIPEEHWYELLGGGRHAVDLGASPGGWTWQLVKEGMLVTAVDNGPMDEALMASGHVEHVRADGFTWRPRRAVDWLVCDIVDKPARVADLIAGWFEDGLCRYSVFNLKLPMKQRQQAWENCRDRLLACTALNAPDIRLQARQLYHDREEITCFVGPDLRRS